jgi:hypothetical protein
VLKTKRSIVSVELGKEVARMSTLSANVGADGVESGKEVARMSTLSVNVGADGGHKKQLAELSKQLKLPQDCER